MVEGGTEELDFSGEPLAVIFTETEDGILMNTVGEANTVEINGRDDMETFFFTWRKRYFNGSFILSRDGKTFFANEQKALFAKKLA
jgi:hypothetical protein